MCRAFSPSLKVKLTCVYVPKKIVSSDNILHFTPWTTAIITRVHFTFKLGLGQLVNNSTIHGVEVVLVCII